MIPPRSTKTAGAGKAAVIALQTEIARRETALLCKLAVLEDGLPEFVRLFWPIFCPKEPLVWGWHLDLICRRLMMSYRGELDSGYLVINIPPRHSKSSLVSVLGPAWVWLTRPQTQFLCVTKSEKNVDRDARLMRTVVTSPLYQQLVATTVGSLSMLPDQNQLRYFVNNHGGHRVSATTNTLIVGVGADVFIADDLLDVKDTMGSPQAVTRRMEDTAAKIDEVWEPRLNPSEIGGQVQLVMQRLHGSDPSNHLLSAGADHVVLPLLYEADHPFVDDEDPRSEGEMIAPGRFNDKDIERAQKNPIKMAGQYQQRPTPRDGGILKKHFFDLRWQSLPSNFAEILISVDGSFKDKESSDPCCIQRWGRTRSPKRIYLIRQRHGRMNAPKLIEAVREEILLAEADHPGVFVNKVIEDKANGSGTIDTLKGEIMGLRGYSPGMSKYERVMLAGVTTLASGVVLFPPDHLAPWMRKIFIPECVGFPRALNDDMVDTMSMAFIDFIQRPIGPALDEVIRGPTRRSYSESRAVDDDDDFDRSSASRHTVNRSRRGGW